MKTIWLVIGMAALAGTAKAEGEKSKLAVLPTQFDVSAEGQVPKLFDDYLLTAVHNIGQYEVIGQDDINALLGFEKQKEIMGCDETSCLADIGGALGVDRIVVVKIARVGNDWVTTGKLINIKTSRVESRSSDFVSGDVKALLRAVPAIAKKLFSGGGTAAVAPEPVSSGRGRAQGSATGPGFGATTPTYGPNPSLGRGARVAGVILGLAGLALSVVSVPVMSGARENCTTDFWTDTTTCGPDSTRMLGGATLAAAGVAITGWGTGLYLNGRARAISGDGNASGYFPLRWLAWGLVPVTWLAPYALMDSNVDTAFASGILAAGAGTLVFAWSMWTSSGYARTSTRDRVPFASAFVVRDPKGGLAPGLRLGIEL